MAYWTKIASVSPTGGAGLASGTSGIVSSLTSANGVVVPSGELRAIFVDYTTMPATTDVTISEVLPSGALRSLLTLTNVNVDAIHQVQVANSTIAGAAGTGFVYPMVGGAFQVDVAQGDAVANGVVVYMLFV